jgi:2-dehydro-3-deoxyphosphogalactonate aldolase
MPLETLLDEMPLVAILRGLVPQHATAIGEALFEAGIRVIEVPLNSPEPFKSIETLSAKFGTTCLCGAGTVLTAADVERVRDAGGRLIVSPNTDPDVIARAVAHKMTVMPGFATATEAFLAIKYGATHLKLFPASSHGPAYVKALKAVLPADIQVYAVGGVGAADVPSWMKAGVSGFGFGSELFKPGYTAGEVAKRARSLVEAVRDARKNVE